MVIHAVVTFPWPIWKYENKVTIVIYDHLKYDEYQEVSRWFMLHPHDHLHLSISWSECKEWSLTRIDELAEKNACKVIHILRKKSKVKSYTITATCCLGYKRDNACTTSIITVYFCNVTIIYNHCLLLQRHNNIQILNFGQVKNLKHCSNEKILNFDH